MHFGIPLSNSRDFFHEFTKNCSFIYSIAFFSEIFILVPYNDRICDQI